MDNTQIAYIVGGVVFGAMVTTIVLDKGLVGMAQSFIDSENAKLAAATAAAKAA